MPLQMLTTRLLSLTLAGLFCSSAWGKDLGVHGRVYDIAERDLIEVLMQRGQAEVDSGEWDKKLERWRKQAKAQTARPQGISLPRASITASHLFDPSVVISRDITDNNGNLLVPAGTHFNPFSVTSLSRHLIFIDGEDPEQIDWMMTLTAESPTGPAGFVVILTDGPILELMNRLDRRLFFDQNQNYVTKLAIRSLPARVYQEAQYLRIDEIALP
jgi:conjugal transfer pilus assembly protein TraW